MADRECSCRFYIGRVTCTDHSTVLGCLCSLHVRHLFRCATAGLRTDRTIVSLRALSALSTGSPSTTPSSSSSFCGCLCRHSSKSSPTIPSSVPRRETDDDAGVPSSSSVRSWFPPWAATSTTLAPPPAASARRPILSTPSKRYVGSRVRVASSLVQSAWL